MDQRKAIIKLIVVLCFAFVFVGTPSYAADRDADEKEGPPRMTQEELRHQVIRFAQRAVARVAQAYDNLEKRAQTSQGRLLALENKLIFGHTALEIAIAPEPEVNLLDMVVFITLTRTLVETYWVPLVFGDQDQELLEVSRRNETEIWSLASRVLQAEQQRELRGMIQEWRKRNPDDLYVENVRFGDFAKILGESALAKAQRSGGLLGITGAARAADEAMLLAERVMVFAQYMPYLMRYHGEVLLYKAAARVSEERKATIDQFVSEEKRVRGVLAAAQKTLTTGNELASQVDTTVGSVDSLVARLHARRKKPMDYEKVATGVSHAAQQLTVLVKEINHLITSPAWDQRVKIFDQMEHEGEVWADHVFRLAVMLILIFLVGSLLTMLSYRYASAKLFRSSQGQGGSSR